MIVANAVISPAFSINIASYTAEVPFSVSKLEISVSAEDAKAKVSINNPTLTPNGTKKVYTIKVKCAQEPNYKASSNNKLAAITPAGFMLSPTFNPDVTSYVVWLPYELKSIKITGTAQDGKGSAEVAGGDQLLAGQDNIVKVIEIAEDSPRKEYIVTVKHDAAHDGSVDEISSTTV